MKSGKALIITDPCYIAKDDDWGKDFDYEENVINLPEFTEYEWSNTGFGDGSFKVYELNEGTDPEEWIEKWVETDDTGKEDLESNAKVLGEFCVDSGTFGVFILEEVFKYNPEFMKEVSSRCYCSIYGYDGPSIMYSDNQDNNHLIFKGNKTIVTI
ncbi:MAG: hypothetical protein J6I84_03005 [Bacilli bacterium]|nr:hypothetical protein [Bacilli bacterium]